MRHLQSDKKTAFKFQSCVIRTSLNLKYTFKYTFKLQIYVILTSLIKNTLV